MLFFTPLVIASLAGLSTALPLAPELTPREVQSQDIAKRQNEAAQALGLGDPDILQFALTLEHLESSFYHQSLLHFPTPESLGLTPQAFDDIHSIGFTESQHVSTLQSALAQAGVAPVRPCEYDFSSAFVSADAFLATAAILENVGVAAYLGAAGLVQDPAILGVAGSILTIEARHQSAIRIFQGVKAVPQGFDASLGLRSVFSLAAPFITSCPEGSNLVVEAFPTLAMGEGQGEISALAAAGAKVQLASDAAGQATHCAFTSGGVRAGGTIFSVFTEGEGCEVPKGVAGTSYLALASEAPLDGVMTDDITIAGPIAVTVT